MLTFTQRAWNVNGAGGLAYEGDDLVFSMAGGISISEDPNFRFTFKPNGAKEFRADGEDTAGKTFSGVWPASRDGA
jgi:sulfur-oxidizing protein SoxY